MGAARNYHQIEVTPIFVHAFDVTPSDTLDFTEYAKSLRIWNPNTTVATIKLDTVDGMTITLSVPPQSLLIEPLYVARVYDTGTTDNLVIHGYA